jgi:pyochelin biosynthesis protein PchC
VVRRLGIAPVAFIASGRRAPSTATANLRHLDDEELLAEVDRLGSVDRRLLDRPDARQLMMPMLRGDYQAIETYRYRPGPPLPCPLSVLAGTADPMTMAEDLQAWRAHTSGEFSLHMFSGGHFFLDDHLAEVAETIRKLLSVCGQRSHRDRPRT